MKLYEHKYMDFILKDDRIDFIWKADTADMDDYGFQYTILRYASFAMEYRIKKVLIDLTDAGLNTATASCTGFQFVFLGLPHIFTHVAVPESVGKLTKGIFTAGHTFKTGVLTGVQLSYFFKPGPVDQQETGAGWTDGTAGTTGNTV